MIGVMSLACRASQPVAGRRMSWLWWQPSRRFSLSLSQQLTEFVFVSSALLLLLAAAGCCWLLLLLSPREGRQGIEVDALYPGRSRI